MSRPPFGPTVLWGITWYAVFIVLGMVLAVWLATREEKRLSLPRDTALDFSLLAIPLGVIGARLYYVLFNLDIFIEEPLRVFYIHEGGMAIYGGVLGGLLAALLLSRRRKIPLSSLLDMVAPGLVLAQAIGRWGNYINMEAYGERVYYEALQFFPFAVEIPIGERFYWQMATFFYEFLVCAVTFVLLMAFRRRMRRRGDVFCWYVLLYCAGRTVVEGLRTDSLTLINASVRVSQILSALACVAVLMVFAVRVKRARGALPFWSAAILSALCLATCFLGEFERGAYSMLFPVTQTVMVLTALFGLAASLWVLWKQGLLRPGQLVLVGLLFAAWALTFALGFGREAYEFADDTSAFGLWAILKADIGLYVSLRQALSMLQLLVFAQILYRAAPSGAKEAIHA